MARQKGMLNLSGNLEPLAGAPLDSRDITPTVADLYIASNWPYKYIGMKTTVTATGDTYRLVNLDVTQESSWVKEGGESGQTIQVESMPMATESDLGKVLQYIGTTDLLYTNGYFYKCVYKNSSYLWEQHNVQPDAEGQTIQVSELPTAAIGQVDKVYQYIGATGNGLVHGYFYECVLKDGSYVWQETEVNEPTEALSSSDMADVKGAFSPVIESVGGLPILFDEAGTERQVGWYRHANGTKQPVYEKCFTGTFAEVTEQGTEGIIEVKLNTPIKMYIDPFISIFSNYQGVNGDSQYIAYHQDYTNNVEGVVRASYHTHLATYGTKQDTITIRSSILKSSEGIYYVKVRYTKTTDTPV